MKNEMFDVFHLTYIFSSLLVTVIILLGAKKYIKMDKNKNLFLKFWGLLTVFLHLSELWVAFLKGGSSLVHDNMLFPIFFCNLSMVLLLITGFIENKSSKAFKYLAIITAYSGVLGSLISLFYPSYYLGDSKLTYHAVKSLLSHSTMLIGCLYLITGKYFKVEKSNTLIFVGGLLTFGAIGLVNNLIFKLAGLESPNSMYLEAPPIDGVNILNVYMLAVLLTLVVLATTVIYEQLNKLMVRRKKVNLDQLPN